MLFPKKNQLLRRMLFVVLLFSFNIAELPVPHLRGLHLASLTTGLQLPWMPRFPFGNPKSHVPQCTWLEDEEQLQRRCFGTGEKLILSCFHRALNELL